MSFEIYGDKSFIDGVASGSFVSVDRNGDVVELVAADDTSAPAAGLSLSPSAARLLAERLVTIADAIQN